MNIAAAGLCTTLVTAEKFQSPQHLIFCNARRFILDAGARGAQLNTFFYHLRPGFHPACSAQPYVGGTMARQGKGERSLSEEPSRSTLASSQRKQTASEVLLTLSSQTQRTVIHSL